MQFYNYYSKIEILRFLKFLLVGLGNTVITLITIYLLLEIFQIDYKISNLIGYLLGLINSFVWSKFWVFKQIDRKFVKEIILFFIFFGICYLIQLYVLELCVEIIQINVFLSQIFSMGIYTILNFTLNKLFTFRAK